jgi:nucleoside-diphosphate-sugar epimerase
VAEYDWTAAARASETATPIAPATRYGQAKAATAASLTGDHAWARLFFSFGAHEDRRRLVPSVLTAALQGGVAPLGPGTDRRCFLDVRDVGRAIAALALSGVQGPVNIGRGEAMAIKDLAAAAVAAAGQGSLAVGALPARPGDPPELVAVVDRLRAEVGFTPTIAIPHALRDAAAWWRGKL